MKHVLMHSGPSHAKAGGVAFTLGASSKVEDDKLADSIVSGAPGMFKVVPSPVLKPAVAAPAVDQAPTAAKKGE